MPQALTLQASPNPFNAQTTLRLSLPLSGDVYLEAFDISGRRVLSKYWEDLPAGNHEIEFAGNDLNSGVYVAEVKNKSGTAATKVMLVK